MTWEIAGRSMDLTCRSWCGMQVFRGVRPAQARRYVRTVDEEEPTVQGGLPDGEGFGVVGGGVPSPQSLHAIELHDDDPAVGRPVAFGYHRGDAANEVAA